MKCKKPFAGVHPCGQCIFCRVNKQREWAYRILLESRLYRHNAFVTLTYKDDSKTSLDPKDLQLFLKKLRRNYEPRTLRFFAVGEYGEQRERPHYHLALFNFPTCSNFRTLHSIQKQCCWSCDLIRKTWGHGIIDVGELNAQTAQYIGGYVTKKMTNIHNEQVREWLKGRHPEFARMSLKPGIATDAAKLVADQIITHELFPHQSCPSTLLEKGRHIYLGRTIKKKIANLTLNQETQNELRSLLQETSLDKEIESYKTQIQEGLSPSQIQIRKDEIQKQILLNQEKKLSLRSKRRKL